VGFLENLGEQSYFFMVGGSMLVSIGKMRKEGVLSKSYTEAVGRAGLQQRGSREQRRFWVNRGAIQ